MNDRKDIVSPSQDTERINKALASVKELLEKHRGVLGGKLELFFAGDGTGETEKNGYYLGKMTLIQLPSGGVELRKTVGIVEGGVPISNERATFMGEEMIAPYNTHLVEMTCKLVTIEGHDIVHFSTIGSVDNLLNSKLGVGPDPEFQKLVGSRSASMNEVVMIDRRSGKTNRILTSTVDMDPQLEVKGKIGGIHMTVGLNNSLRERRMRQVERGADGKLRVKEGRFIDGKRIVWDDVKVVK